MISTKMIYNVLSKVAGISKISEKPVKRFRYYFYDAPPEYSIKFTHLTKILEGNTPEKDALIEKLKGGNTGKYCADYFRWKRVFVVTNQYTDGNIVYEADLTPIGTKVVGTEKIYPSDADVNLKDVEDDLLLYTTKRGNSNVINIDVGESYFSDREIPKGFVKILLSGMQPSGFMDYNEFSRIFDEYRIWVPNLNQLLLPNFDIPKTDDVKGGHYKGGYDAFVELVTPYLKKKEKKEEKKPSLKEKLEEEEIFKPVSEQKPEKVEGEYLDTKTASMVIKVVRSYLKEAGMMPMQPAAPGRGKGELSKKLLEDAKKHEEIRKKLEETAKAISDIGYEG